MRRRTAVDAAAAVARRLPWQRRAGPPALREISTGRCGYSGTPRSWPAVHFSSARRAHLLAGGLASAERRGAAQPPPPGLAGHRCSARRCRRPVQHVHAAPGAVLASWGAVSRRCESVGGAGVRLQLPDASMRLPRKFDHMHIAHSRFYGSFGRMSRAVPAGHRNPKTLSKLVLFSIFAHPDLWGAPCILGFAARRGS